MKQMIEILKKQLEIYKEILKISEDKTDIIVEDKVDDLKPMVYREEALISNYISLEKESEYNIASYSATPDFTLGNTYYYG